MKGYKHTSSILACLIGISFFFPACAFFNKGLSKDPFNLKHNGIAQYPAAEAETVFETLVRRNQDIKTIKGIGTFYFDHQNERYSSRMAWIGLRQDDQNGKIRLEILGPHGQSVASLAANDGTFYFFSHAENRYYKKALTDASLVSYLKIPITVNEMVDFLSGRIPIDGYDQIALTENESGEGVILYIFKKDPKTVLKIYLDTMQGFVYKAEFVRSVSKYSYQIEFVDPKAIDAFEIPFQIKIVDDKGSNFLLKMDRVWANANVDEGIFTLTRPE